MFQLPASAGPGLASHERLIVRLKHSRPGQTPFELERVPPTDPRHPTLGPASFQPADPAAEGRIERQIIQLSRKLDALSRRWNASTQRVPDWVQRALDWLARWKRPDEELLRALCSAEAVHVEHPASWKPSRARRRWIHLVRSGRNHNFFGLVVCLLLLPLSLLLTVVPGPNVLGLWFTYRVLSHSLAWLGARRVLKGGLPVTIVPAPESNAEAAETLMRPTPEACS